MSKSGFLHSATVQLFDLQGQNQKTSLVSLSCNDGVKKKNQNEIPEVEFRQSLGTQTQEASPKVPAQMASTLDSPGPGCLKLLHVQKQVYLN